MILKYRQFQAGEVLIHERSYGTEAFELKTGRVQVTKQAGEQQIVLATLGAGQIFGEMGLIEDRPRSATVTAIEDGEALVIDRESFTHLLMEEPQEIIALLRTIFERFRQVSQLLAEHMGGEFHTVSSSPQFKVLLSGLTEDASRVLGDEEIEICTFPFKIGRLSHLDSSNIFDDNDLHIIDQQPYRVSRNHCAIIEIGGSLSVVDRGSRLGTIVSDERLGMASSRTRLKLSPGAHTIILGTEDSPFRFKLAVD